MYDPGVLFERDLMTTNSAVTGKHVGLVAASDHEFDELVRPLLEEGTRSGEKLVVFGSDQYLGAAALPIVDRPSPLLMAAELRREVDIALRDGYRGVRFLADMGQLGMTPLSTQDVLAFELALDHTVNTLGATMLCSYRSPSFRADAVAAAMSAHLHGYGVNRTDLGFQMWSDSGRWNVRGAVDLVNVDSFRTAMRSAATGQELLRLSLADLRFLDLAGVQAIADLAESVPGLTLRVEASPNAFRRCWRMLGYDETCPRAEIVD